MAKRTPLYQNHLNHGGKVVEFGGFELPVQYGAGLIAEHNAVRNAAGLFDVSHMGEFLLEGKSAFDTIQRLMSNDMTGLCDGQIRYTMMLNERGGEVDDLLVYRLSEEKYLLVVNAGNCDKDAAWVSNRLLDGTRFENLSEKTGQVALQGPKSEEILRKILPESEIPEKYYTFKVSDRVTDGRCIVSRTGYTGEDGFEIYCPAERTPEIFEKIFDAGKEYGILPCGLGARDTLRFEACMPLYGHELNEDYLGHEVGLGFALKMGKPDFIGKRALEERPAQFKRKGVKLIDKGIAREGCEVFAASDGRKIGVVTTGTYSPTFQHALAMVRIEKSYEEPEVVIDVRGKKLRAEVVKMPFYKRG